MILHDFDENRICRQCGYHIDEMLDRATGQIPYCVGQPVVKPTPEIELAPRDPHDRIMDDHTQRAGQLLCKLFDEHRVPIPAAVMAMCHCMASFCNNETDNPELINERYSNTVRNFKTMCNEIYSSKIIEAAAKRGRHWRRDGTEDNSRET